jgi:Tfp pilus assembly protein PilX
MIAQAPLEPAERPLNHHNKESPAFVRPANPANAPTINVIANGDFSEEPQKPILNLHGTNAWLCGAGQSR